VLLEGVTVLLERVAATPVEELVMLRRLWNEGN
jgi:hypothetical protein